jgi:hypothetical protein
VLAEFGEEYRRYMASTSAFFSPPGASAQKRRGWYDYGREADHSFTLSVTWFFILSP